MRIPDDPICSGADEFLPVGKVLPVERLMFTELAETIKAACTDDAYTSSMVYRSSRRGLTLRLVVNFIIDEGSPMMDLVTTEISTHGGTDIEFNKHYIQWLLPRSFA